MPQTKEPALSDDDEATELVCEPCNKKFNNIESMKLHFKCKKHFNKMRASNPKSLADKIQEIVNTPSSSEDDDEKGQFFCEECKTQCSGRASYLAHIKGYGHLKVLKREKISAELANGAIEEDDSLEEPEIFSRCETCDKSFNGPESHKSHLKSAGHKKKVQLAKLSEKFKSDTKEDSHHSDEDDTYPCSVCNRSIIGAIQYRTHLKSSAHKKAIKRAEIVKSIDDNQYEIDAETGTYICKECHAQFSDPAALRLHLKSGYHGKKKSKEDMVDFANSNPGLVMTKVMIMNHDASDDEDHVQPGDYMLTCKICSSRSFIDLASAKAHVNSKKHINARKDREFKKALNANKKESVETQPQTNRDATKFVKKDPEGNIDTSQEKAKGTDDSTVNDNADDNGFELL